MPDITELDNARLLFKENKRVEAREVLINAVRNHPKNPDIWYALSYCVDEFSQKKDCLERVLTLSPGHPKAKGILEKLLVGDSPSFLATVSEQDDNKSPTIISNEGATLNGYEPQKLVDQVPGNAIEDILITNIEEQYSQIKSLKKAGKSTHKMEIKSRRVFLVSGILLISVIGILGILFQYHQALRMSPYLALVIFFAMAGVTIYSFIKLNKLGNRWDKFRFGTIAEELVGEILKNLGPDYVVIHDIQLGYGNIDHFVIGKNGNIYMIETKSHRGKVAIEGENIRINNKRPEKDFVKQAQRNSYDLRDEIASILGISLNVTPILVFTNAYTPYKAIIKGIFIMNKKDILKFIRSGKERLNHKIIWEKRGVINLFLNRPRW